MRKNKSRDLTNKTSTLTEKEIKELEELEEVFGKKFKPKVIERDSVYGYIDNKKRYLGTKNNYYRYEELKNKTYVKKRRASEYRLETYNNFNL